MQAKRVADAADLDRLAPVLQQLRPRYDVQELKTLVEAQLREGYELVYVEDEGKIVAVAGSRVSHKLAWGLHLYVDDLVTAEHTRSKGYGAFLLKWLVNDARERGCTQFHLDSGVQNHDAHGFYLNAGFRIASHHFSIVDQV